MKNLFKILLLVLTIGFLSSCNEEIEKVSNPSETTTVAAQQAQKDTMLVYHKNDEQIWLMNTETNVVEYKLYGEDHNITVFWFGLFMGMFVMVVLLGVFGAFE